MKCNIQFHTAFCKKTLDLGIFLILFHSNFSSQTPESLNAYVKTLVSAKEGEDGGQSGQNVSSLYSQFLIKFHAQKAALLSYTLNPEERRLLIDLKNLFGHEVLSRKKNDGKKEKEGENGENSQSTPTVTSTPTQQSLLNDISWFNLGVPNLNSGSDDKNKTKVNVNVENQLQQSTQTTSSTSTSPQQSTPSQQSQQQAGTNPLNRDIPNPSLYQNSQTLAELVSTGQIVDYIISFGCRHNGPNFLVNTVPFFRSLQFPFLPHSTIHRIYPQSLHHFILPLRNH